MDPAFARLTLPARVESVGRFHEFVRKGAQGVGVEPSDLDKLDLVLEEILVNIARYAYDSRTGNVEVAYACDGACLSIEIIDWGRLFNPLEATLPDLAVGLADRPIGGLGILLVKQIVGALAYRREDDQNIVSFRFPSRIASSAE